MANYSTYFNLLCGRIDVLIIYAVIMNSALSGLVIMHHVCVRLCVQSKLITCTNTCTYNKYCIWLFKNFYKLVSWMTNQLFGKQMSLDKDDKSILTFNGRQHKIENRCQLINILVWMFLSEISVISTLIALVIIKSKYDITITNTCWPGLHTGTDCFPIDIDNFTSGEFEADIPPVNCNEWDNTNPVVCFERKYFPLTVALALLTALIKLILPILMSITGVIMNIITYCFLRCNAVDFIKKYCFLHCYSNACYMTIVHLFRVMLFIAITIALARDNYHWIRYLESKGYDYIAELIAGTGVITQELLIFPWIDLRQIRIDEDDKIFSDDQNNYDNEIFSDDQSNYGTFNNTPSSVEARLVS